MQSEGGKRNPWVCIEDSSYFTVLAWVREVASLFNYYFSFPNKYELLLNRVMIAGGLSSRNYFQADKYTEHSITTCISGKHHARLFKDSLTWYRLSPLKMAQIVSFYYIQLDWMCAICKEQYYHKKKKRGVWHICHTIFPHWEWTVSEHQKVKICSSLTLCRINCKEIRLHVLL